jgi:RNA polymerase sigma-70 factor (ECF subfamily)
MSRNPAHETLFQEWLETYRGIFFKVTRSFARTATEAGELQQEIRLQLWNSLPAFSGQAQASTWIYRVCLNTALAWRRGTDRRQSKIEPTADISQLSASTASPAESVGEREILEKLYAAIHAMDGFDRALVLMMLDGLAYRQIADVTGLTETHVGVALTRARQRLATLMKGVTDELE